MAHKELAELLATLEKSQDHFRRHVIPIFQDNERGQPELFGTALVVAKGKHVLLVSAAHVFDPLAEGRTLFVYTGRKTKRALGGELRRTNKVEGTRDKDKLDIGVLLLTGKNLPPYPKVNCKPLDTAFLQPTEMPWEGKHFLTLGYRCWLSAGRSFPHSGAASCCQHWLAQPAGE